MGRGLIGLLILLTVAFSFYGTASADTSRSSPPELVPPELKKIAEIASAISTVYGGVTNAIKLLELLGFIPTGPTEKELLQAIDAKIDDVADLLFDQTTAIGRASKLADAQTATDVVAELRKDANALCPTTPAPARLACLSKPLTIERDDPVQLDTRSYVELYQWRS